MDYDITGLDYDITVQIIVNIIYDIIYMIFRDEAGYNRIQKIKSDTIIRILSGKMTGYTRIKGQINWIFKQNIDG